MDAVVHEIIDYSPIMAKLGRTLATDCTQWQLAEHTARLFVFYRQAVPGVNGAVCIATKRRKPNGFILAVDSCIPARADFPERMRAILRAVHIIRPNIIPADTVDFSQFLQQELGLA